MTGAFLLPPHDKSLPIFWNAHTRRKYLLPLVKIALWAEPAIVIRLSTIQVNTPTVWRFCASFSHSLRLSTLIFAFISYVAFRGNRSKPLILPPNSYPHYLVSVMEEERSLSCYDGNAVDLFHFYLSETKEHEFCLRFLQDVLPSHFKR